MTYTAWTKTNNQHAAVLSVYIPTQDAINVVKDKLILGDFNARDGKEFNFYNGISCKYRVDNANGHLHELYAV